jgi:hypothetical protein
MDALKMPSPTQFVLQRMFLLSMIASILVSMALPGDEVWCQEAVAMETKTVRSRGELLRALQEPKPGTTVLIAPGSYRGGMSFGDLHGAEGRPIVIAALDPSRPPVFEGGAVGFHLRRPRYVELRDLVFSKATANGLNIDDGGTPDEPARHLVLRRLEIRDVGPKGNRDGIKMSGVDHFTVDRCVVERWGDAGSAIDMVGCHRGRITGCRFQYRGDVAANGVQTKGGSSDILIQRCRFQNAGGRAVNIGGSTGLPYFRPQGVGYEAKEITVEDCTFIGSMAPIAFVGVDGAAVRYNTIYRPSRWVIRILQETQLSGFVPCRNGRFLNNLIVYDGNEVRSTVNVGGGTDPESFEFASNLWYRTDNPEQSRPRDLPVEEREGRYGIAPSFVNEPGFDLTLDEPSRIQGAGVRAENDE